MDFAITGDRRHKRKHIHLLPLLLRLLRILLDTYIGVLHASEKRVDCTPRLYCECLSISLFLPTLLECGDQMTALEANIELTDTEPDFADVLLDILFDPEEGDNCQFGGTLADTSVNCAIDLRGIEGSSELVSACRNAGGKGAYRRVALEGMLILVDLF